MKTERASKATLASERFSVICHNGDAIVSGKFLLVSETGCEIQDEGEAATPRFALRAPIILNILDLKKGKTMNVRAITTDVRRQEGVWVYRILWAKSPEILAAKKSKRSTRSSES
jgi:hypothetical protein